MVFPHRAMLYHGGSASLTDIEWVVFDEVHYINDEQVVISFN